MLDGFKVFGDLDPYLGEIQLGGIAAAGAVVKDLQTGLIAAVVYANLRPDSPAAKTLSNAGLDFLLFNKSSSGPSPDSDPGLVLVPPDPGSPGDVVVDPTPVPPVAEDDPDPVPVPGPEPTPDPEPDPDPDPDPDPAPDPEPVVTFSEWLSNEFDKPLLDTHTHDNVAYTIRALFNETVGSASETRVMVMHVQWQDAWYSLSLAQFVALMYRGHAYAFVDGNAATVSMVDVNSAFSTTYGEQFIPFMLRCANGNYPSIRASATLVPVSALYNRDAVIAGTYPRYEFSPSETDAQNGYSVVITSVTSEEVSSTRDGGGRLVRREWTVNYTTTRGTFSEPPEVTPTTVTRGTLLEAMAKGDVLNYTAAYPIRYFHNNAWEVVLSPEQMLHAIVTSNQVLSWIDSLTIRHDVSMSDKLQGVIKPSLMYYVPDENNPGGAPL
jgi:hypothetical protein